MRYIIVTFTVTHEGEHYVSRCPELGTASFGRDEEDALRKLAEATELYLETLEDLGERARVLQEKHIRVFVDEPGSREIKCPIGENSVVRSAVFPLQAALA